MLLSSGVDMCEASVRWSGSDVVDTGGSVVCGAAVSGGVRLWLVWGVTDDVWAVALCCDWYCSCCCCSFDAGDVGW